MDIGEIAEIADPSSPRADQAPSLERDEAFYFKFETVTFRVHFNLFFRSLFIIYTILQVEDTLFRVFKRGFQVQGTTFETMFSLPENPSGIVEGTDDSHPIHLHGISKVKFQCFLRVLYPL
jgi:hypothetical protein